MALSSEANFGLASAQRATFSRRNVRASKNAHKAAKFTGSQIRSASRLRLRADVAAAKTDGRGCDAASSKRARSTALVRSALSESGLSQMYSRRKNARDKCRHPESHRSG